MIPKRIGSVVLSCVFLLGSAAFAAESEENTSAPKPADPGTGSWTFTGTVTNENGERYGYFFQAQKQGVDFHTKTALIDERTNQLLIAYEADEKITEPDSLNWHIGRSFIHYNPINDSWIFGVKAQEGKGFNFKVDMLKQASEVTETLVLRPGVELQTTQTTRLNGHIQTGTDAKEQFVTGNNAWFGKLWFSQDQKTAHTISTTFCRLNDDNGFYAANLKEADATSASVAGWRDPNGKKLRMSQFLSVKQAANNLNTLSLGQPKLHLQLLNTLAANDKMPQTIAGFSNKDPKGFCFITELSFAQVLMKNDSMIG